VFEVLLTRCVPLPLLSSPAPAHASLAGIYTLLFLLVNLAFIPIPTLPQLAALARLPFITTDGDLATQLAAKSNAALSVLRIFHSVGAVFGVRAPLITFVQALAGTASGLAALVRDPQFGAGVVHDILALALAQRRLWLSALTYLALACEAVAVVKFAMFRVC
jgi:hypothetical protein